MYRGDICPASLRDGTMIKMFCESELKTIGNTYKNKLFINLKRLKMRECMQRS